VTADPEKTESPAPTPAFAHASEAEMARILDFYAVRWEYEPYAFPLLWNLEGDVVESFTPDFYLPDLDLYLELTTLRQRLVRKKNRKLRRLRELYPDVRIKLFYARDFRALMLKYGKLALFEGMAGTLGQVVPEDRATIADSVAPAPASAAVPAPPRRPRRRTAADAAIPAPRAGGAEGSGG
jgi:hypoxanthine phosphoribosyltransferase